jgi:hypothetical protein
MTTETITPTTNPDAPGAAPEPADTTVPEAIPRTDPAADAVPHPSADPYSAEAAARLADRLASVEAAAADLRRMLEQSERDRAIDRELLARGVIDLDSARTLVEERLATGETTAEAVARLRERRPALFTTRPRTLRATTPAASAGAPDASLSEVAHAARESGDRRLLLDYLRLRRTPS